MLNHNWCSFTGHPVLQVAEVFRTNEDHLILNSIKACSVSGDIDGVENYIEKFREHAEHMQEVKKLDKKYTRIHYNLYLK